MTRRMSVHDKAFYKNLTRLVSEKGIGQMTPEFKVCSRCETEKEIVEFYRDKYQVDGIRTICKDCDKAYAKQRYQENPVLYRRKGKEYYAAHRSERIAYARNRYRDNSAVLSARSLNYYRENRESVIKKMREYYLRKKKG